MELDFKEKLHTAVKNSPVIIYGAHLIAVELYRYLKNIYGVGDFLGFAVTSGKDNPLRIGKEKVAELPEYKSRTDALILIAMPKKYHVEVEKYARKFEFQSFLRIDLETMTYLKKGEILAVCNRQKVYRFRLFEDAYDGSWLNMTNDSEFQDRTYNLTERHYKFPVLYHLDIAAVLHETKNFDFYNDYKRVFGIYRNLHSFSDNCVMTYKNSQAREELNIYMVFSQWDSAAVIKHVFSPWIFPIQAGSALSDKKSSCCLDETGMNISKKNRIFAEMTVAYWIWKNAEKVKYKGLCHYRRHFILTKEEVMLLDTNHVDVILTTPRYAPGGIGRMFLAETPVKKPVYQNMLDAVAECSPEDADLFSCYMDTCLYYPNNMVIARCDIYDTYCEWIFPILFKMLEIDMHSGYGHYEDRHIAYAAELLTSYYFVKHRHDYCIVVTDYKFYA